MSQSEAEAYGERPVSPEARLDPQTFEKLNISRGDRLELVLVDGTYLEGEYLELQAPTTGDPEMYVFLTPKRQNGQRASAGETRRQVAFSEVRTLSVKVPDYSWIEGGAAVGVALDAFMVSLLGRGLSD